MALHVGHNCNPWDDCAVCGAKIEPPYRQRGGQERTKNMAKLVGGKPDTWPDTPARRPRRRRPSFVAAITGDAGNNETVHLVAAAMSMADEGVSKPRIAEVLGVSRATVYRLLRVRARLAGLVDEIDRLRTALHGTAIANRKPPT